MIDKKSKSDKDLVIFMTIMVLIMLMAVLWVVLPIAKAFMIHITK